MCSGDDSDIEGIFKMPSITFKIFKNNRKHAPVGCQNNPWQPTALYFHQPFLGPTQNVMTPSKYFLKTILIVFVVLSSLLQASADGLPSVFRYEAVNREFAYSENIPKDALHPLRVLGSTATGCDDWMSFNFDGIDAYGIPDSELEESVCGLMDILPAAYKDSFMVFDYGAYPPLTFIDRGEAHDCAFNAMVEKVENDFDPPYYLLIGKQINPEDASVEFRVALKLPKVNEFADLNSTLVEGIRNAVKGEIESHHADWNSLVMLQTDEIAGINKLKEMLETLFSGGFSGGLTEAMLDLNGFEEIGIDPDYPANWVDSNEGKQTGGNIKDYARRKVFSEFSGDYVFVADNVSYGFQVLSNQFGATGAVILTENSNYNAGASSDFEDANEDFESLAEDLIVWLHYYEPADTAQPKKIYIKAKVNYTREQAQDKINALFEDYKSGSGHYAIKGEEEEKSSADPVDCSKFDCDEVTKWRAYCCLQNYIEANFKASELSFLGNHGLTTEVADATAQYLAALGCGVIDGVIELAGMTGNLVGKGLIFASEAIRHTPGSKVWFQEVLILSWKKKSFMEAYEIKTDADKVFWGGVFDKFTQFVELFKNLSWGQVKVIFKAIWEEVINWVDNITGQNGSFNAGYEMGKFIFEMMFDFLTGGSGKIAKIGGDVMKNLVKGLNGTGTKIKSVMSSAWNSSYVSDTKRRLCMIGIGGCFVKGTPVLMAGMMTVPIEEIKLLDWALANNVVNSRPRGLHASTNQILSTFHGKDPLTSDQQRERDQNEFNDQDWYEVTFKEIVGDSYCKLALHQDWMKQQGMTEVGSIHELNMPEQGIHGPNIIASIKHILPQKRPIDEDPHDNYGYRPVTGIFVHSSDDVWTIHFDNGDSLGVTYNHPVFSDTYNDWRLAGDLQIGEQVKTKFGSITVISKKNLQSFEEVYNLEVKGLHNFLVSKSKVVVHNTCFIKNLSDLPELSVKPIALTDIQIPPEYFTNMAGIFENAQGKKIIKIEDPKPWQYPNNTWIDFVIMENGELRIGKGHGYMSGHTSPTEHNKILGAGQMRLNIHTGRVLDLNDNSGHFLPTGSEFTKIKQAFVYDGLLY